VLNGRSATPQPPQGIPCKKGDMAVILNGHYRAQLKNVEQTESYINMRLLEEVECFRFDFSIRLPGNIYFSSTRIFSRYVLVDHLETMNYVLTGSRFITCLESPTYAHPVYCIAHFVEDKLMRLYHVDDIDAHFIRN